MRGAVAVSEVRLRPFQPGDREACLEVFDSNVPAYFSEDERQEFADFLDALPGPYLVLVDPSGRVVACGGYAVVEAGRRADLCWGMVRAELHRGGLGRRLSRERIAAARSSAPLAVVALNTSQHTVDFYRRLGFELASVEPNGYAHGLDRCEMRLRPSSVAT